MILLCSNGLTSQVLLKEAGKFCGARAALIVTADPVYKDVARSVQQLEYLGCLPCRWSYQVVEMIGGNPYYLLALSVRSGESVLRRKRASWGSSVGPTFAVADCFISHLRENVRLDNPICQASLFRDALI